MHAAEHNNRQRDRAVGIRDNRDASSAMLTVVADARDAGAAGGNRGGLASPVCHGSSSFFQYAVNRGTQPLPAWQAATIARLRLDPMGKSCWDAIESTTIMNRLNAGRQRGPGQRGPELA
ncbi:hypothetical protein PVAR5_7051 [Paecilomyces variotii No. 5]|uniref:Uncharacterized protein n=1 Tax=Byssochlamys spectabilis (strain No. 5 / NBRC 109023) TaxID=1356009 RepID=V5FKF7_BYSSN|nr:hypothetical protein PVAR5_7051 [Paecilomyces variotii No. 5]